MLAFAERITDEAKLDRVLPYIVAMLNDRADIVKVAAISDHGSAGQKPHRPIACTADFL